MRKMRRVAAVALSAAMVASMVTGCGSSSDTSTDTSSDDSATEATTAASDDDASSDDASSDDTSSSESTGEGETINVWAFTDEVPNMIKKFKETHPDFKYEIKETIIATTDGAYQPALDQALAAGGEDAPDIYAAEAAFVLKYTQGDMASYACPYDDLGIDTQAEIDEAKIAQYTVDIGTNPESGKVVGLGYQATGGAFIYRRSIAKDAFGTDDPAEIAEIIGSGSGNWDKFYEAAENQHLDWNLLDKNCTYMFELTIDFTYMYFSYYSDGTRKTNIFTVRIFQRIIIKCADILDVFHITAHIAACHEDSSGIPITVIDPINFAAVGLYELVEGMADIACIRDIHHIIVLVNHFHGTLLDNKGHVSLMVITAVVVVIHLMAGMYI